LLVAANVVNSLLILITLKTEAKYFSKASVLTRATWHHIPEDDTLQGVVIMGRKEKAKASGTLFK
jgi:hypothetical protein